MEDKYIDRNYIEECWIKRFKVINNRKPKHLESLSWRVGFSMGCDAQEELQKSAPNSQPKSTKEDIQK